MSTAHATAGSQWRRAIGPRSSRGQRWTEARRSSTPTAGWIAAVGGPAEDVIAGRRSICPATRAKTFTEHVTSPLDDRRVDLY